jgi:hypothetical protein
MMEKSGLCIEEISLVYKKINQPLKNEEKTCNYCGVRIPWESGIFTVYMKFYCKNCMLFNHGLHLPYYVVENNAVIERVDYSTDRGAFVSFIYNFLGKGTMNNRNFGLIKSYNAKWPYIDMIRALEYHYVVKKQPINSKHKYSIGLIPYVIEDAKKWYEQELENQRTKVKQNIQKENTINPNKYMELILGVMS